MAKCSECGFLAIWNKNERSFSEAYQEFRKAAPYEDLLMFNAVVPSCFVRRLNLEAETWENDSISQLPTLELKIKAILDEPRSCDGFTPWLQGFHPKEHKQMLLNEAMLESQRAHERNSLQVAQNSLSVAQSNFKVAIGALLLSLAATIITAIITYVSAGREADATLKAADSQNEVQREVSKQQDAKPPQTINLNVYLTETKDGKKLEKK